MELINPSRQHNVNVNATATSLKESKRVNSPPSSPSLYLEEQSSFYHHDHQEEEEVEASPEISALIHAITFHLEEALRAAKTSYLGAGEVVFPTKLLPAISRDILRMAESEPLGLRGCLIHLNFQSATTSQNQTDLNNACLNRSHSASSLSSTSSEESSSSSSTASSSKASAAVSSKAPNTRNIGRIKWDARSVATFELSLTFRQEYIPWYSRLPHILRLSKKPTVVLSGDYMLSKKKLYRSGRQ